MTIPFTTAILDAGSDSPSALRAHTQRIAEVLLSTQQGKLNAIGEITLTANTTTTTMTDARVTYQSVIILVPLTANARTIQQTTGYYVTNRKSGSCTITHANTAQTDQTYAFAILG